MQKCLLVVSFSGAVKYLQVRPKHPIVPHSNPNKPILKKNFPGTNTLALLFPLSVTKKIEVYNIDAWKTLTMAIDSKLIDIMLSICIFRFMAENLKLVARE
jgi:hypothetical protein